MCSRACGAGVCVCAVTSGRKGRRNVRQAKGHLDTSTARGRIGEGWEGHRRGTNVGSVQLGDLGGEKATKGKGGGQSGIHTWEKAPAQKGDRREGRVG